MFTNFFTIKPKLLLISFFLCVLINIKDSNSKTCEVCDLTRLGPEVSLFSDGCGRFAVGQLNSDGSNNHGLFQISDKFWCVEGQVDGACGVDCKALRDENIKDDSVCAWRIHRVTKLRTRNGFNARAVWKQRCQNQDVNSYIQHCK